MFFLSPYKNVYILKLVCRIKHKENVSSIFYLGLDCKLFIQKMKDIKQASAMQKVSGKVVDCFGVAS
jgi:hypothetical protein